MRMLSHKDSAMVCHCLKVTETELRRAIQEKNLQSLVELIRCTGAGQGCTACHSQLKEYVKENGYLADAVSPICSAR